MLKKKKTWPLLRNLSTKEIKSLSVNKSISCKIIPMKEEQFKNKASYNKMLILRYK